MTDKNSEHDIRTSILRKVLYLIIDSNAHLRHAESQGWRVGKISEFIRYSLSLSAPIYPHESRSKSETGVAM